MNDRPCDMLIDWELLYDAKRFYQQYLESTYIEVPWIVDPDVAGITTDQNEIDTSYGRLVGSAEQGFLQLVKEGKIFNKEIIYHSISPCFRADTMDELHERHFMKLELFELLGKTSNEEKRLREIGGEAFKFFRGQKLECEIVPTGNLMYDIVSKNLKIEVGSYGIKSHDFGGDIGEIKWVYGTGLALPRFSRSLALEGWFYERR